MIDLESYNYELPARLLANQPVSPRDSARLFVYDTKTDQIFFDTFLNLDKYLPKDSLLVFNDTKVVPARVHLHREKQFGGRGGGKVEVLLLMNEWRPGDKLIKGMVDRKVELGQKLYFDNKNWLEAKKQEANIFYFCPNFAWSKLRILLDQYGETPIPHYLKEATLNEKKLRERYQSVFAKHSGSVAAPTASLHFTSRVLGKLKRRGIDRTFVTLNVGMGTFAPISEESFRLNKLHSEWIEVSKKTAEKINHARSRGFKIVTVGTTATRTLESAVVAGKKFYKVNEIRGNTDIFIYPPYHFKLVDALLTNFHLPKSSLMLLVDAFLEDKKAKKGIFDLYEIAIKNDFRFYSFGDAMLVL